MRLKPRNLSLFLGFSKYLAVLCGFLLAAWCFLLVIFIGLLISWSSLLPFQPCFQFVYPSMAFFPSQCFQLCGSFLIFWIVDALGAVGLLFLPDCLWLLGSISFVGPFCSVS